MSMQGSGAGPDQHEEGGPPGEGAGAPPPMPLWVKVAAGIALAVIVLLVLVLAFGPGEHGPRRHGPEHAADGTTNELPIDADDVACVDGLGGQDPDAWAKGSMARQLIDLGQPPGGC